MTPVPWQVADDLIGRPGMATRIEQRCRAEVESVSAGVTRANRGAFRSGGRTAGVGAMLKIHVVRQGGHHYYVDDLVPGRAEGTGVAGESPGIWTGRAATALGVVGTVSPGEFGDVLEGRHPGSGAGLRMSAGSRSVAGYDLTFCAPKSVSILHLLGPAEMADQVGQGHVCAVAEATAYLEREATGVRRSRHGQASLQPAVGVVAGSFVHRTSRALDPHLHTHLVVANVTQGVDGAWSSMDGRKMFAHVRAIQALYHACLRLELSNRLGATWDVRPSGLGDVVGVDATIRRLYSGRTAGIEEHLAGEAGHGMRPSPRRAFHATRPEKDRAGTVEDLVAGWKRRAADFGYDLGDLTRVVGRPRTHSVGRIDNQRLQDRLAELAVRRRTLTRHDMVAVVARAAPDGVGTRAAEQVAARLIEAAGPPVAHRRGRESMASPGGEREVVVPRWEALAVLRAVEHRPEALAAPIDVSQARSSDGLAPTVVGRPTPHWKHDRSVALDPGRRLSPARSRAAVDLGR